ncbi:MAG: protein kinase [Planctomycetes bacterium]|nr:protein kinase [Planctomycetota bacterium]
MNRTRDIHCACETVIRLPDPEFTGSLVCPGCGVELYVAPRSDRKPLVPIPAHAGSESPELLEDELPSEREERETRLAQGTSSGRITPVTVRLPDSPESADFGSDTMPIDFALHSPHHEHSATAKHGLQFGHFEVIERIGEGGMGRVYLAKDTALDRLVALKVLAKNSAFEESRDRFFREARSAAKITHENICYIYYIGSDLGEDFFTMEYVEGGTLEERIEKFGKLPWEEVAELILQAARGLRAAFWGGIIHRDVKPSNLLIRWDGLLKVADFGLSKQMKDQKSLTKQGIAVGTPHYMSPEQGIGDQVDHRADIYSLGATAFHMLSGEVPFDSDNPLSIMMKHASMKLPDLRTMVADVPERLIQIIEKMMQKRPEDRYPDYDALIHDLEIVRPHALHSAGFFVRVNSTLSDFFIAAGTSGMFVIAMTALKLQRDEAELGLRQILREIPNVAFADYFLLFFGLFVIVYDSLTSILFGGTLGKRLLDIAIIRDHGYVLSWWRSILRATIKWLPVPLMWFAGHYAAFGVLFVFAILLAIANVAMVPMNSRRRSLVDFIIGSRVIYSFQPSELLTEDPWSEGNYRAKLNPVAAMNQSRR